MAKKKKRSSKKARSGARRAQPRSPAAAEVPPAAPPKTRDAAGAAPPAAADEPSAARRGLPARVLGVAAAAVVVVALGLAGAERVREGEVAVVRGGDGGVSAVWDEGLHWRLPWGGEVRRLPVEPLELTRDVEVQTAEGATVTLEVAGFFSIVGDRAEEWAAAAGWAPFVDALDGLAAETLTPAIRRIDPAALFKPEAEEALAVELEHGLESQGARVEGLSVRAPPERNPVATAVLRGELASLASPTGEKVLVIGWDGADWLMIRPLLEQGRLPNLARLIDRGVSGELRSVKPLLSPLIWTSMATGKHVTEHGIADFLVKDPETDALVPISSSYRKVHALWTLLGAFGLSSDVVAWWATWPAEPIVGTMVTDRVAYQLFEVQDTSAEGKVHPASAWERLEPLLVTAEDVPYEEVQRYIAVDREELARRWESVPAGERQEDRVNHLRKILATTESYHRIALSLLEEQADLTMVYYEGTDTVGHLFARFLPPRMRGVSAEEVQTVRLGAGRVLRARRRAAGRDPRRPSDDDTTDAVDLRPRLLHRRGAADGRSLRLRRGRAAVAPSARRAGRRRAGDRARGRSRGRRCSTSCPRYSRVLGLPVPEDMPGPGVGTEVVPAMVPGPRPAASGWRATRSSPDRPPGAERPLRARWTKSGCASWWRWATSHRRFWKTARPAAARAVAAARPRARRPVRRSVVTGGRAAAPAPLPGRLHRGLQPRPHPPAAGQARRGRGAVPALAVERSPELRPGLGEPRPGVRRNAAATAQALRPPSIEGFGEERLDAAGGGHRAWWTKPSTSGRLDDAERAPAPAGSAPYRSTSALLRRPSACWPKKLRPQRTTPSAFYAAGARASTRSTSSPPSRR